MHWVGNGWEWGVYVGRLFSKMAAAYLDDCSDDDCGVVAHIRDILELLSHYQWIYDVKITELFKERTWEKMPADWCQFMSTLSLDELGMLPECRPEGVPPCVTAPTSLGSCPKSLSDFINSCQRLSLARGVVDAVTAKAVAIRKELAKGMTPKKKHEVSQMAGFVAELCQEWKCTAVVDVGAGLGYLGQCLSVQCGLNVYCIECVEGRAQTAAARMDKIVRGRKKMEYVGKVPVGGKSPMDQSEHDAVMVDKDKSSKHSCFCLDGRHHVGEDMSLADDQKRRHVGEDMSLADDQKRHHVGEDMSLADDQKRRHVGEDMSLADDQKRHHVGEDMSLADDQKRHHVGELQESADTSLVGERVCTAVKEFKGFSSDTPSQRERCYHGDSETIAGSFSVVPLTIGDSEESILQFEKLLATVSSQGNDRVCLIGLHCCGDLTPVILRWFSRTVTSPCLRALVLVGCCYHKMTSSKDMCGCSGSQFGNFPMSPVVRKCLEEVKTGSPHFSINTLAMRLAAQETKARWGGQSAEDHTRHMKSLSYRAIVEVSLQRVSINAMRKVDLRTMKNKSSFTSYVDDILSGYSLAGVKKKEVQLIKDTTLDAYKELAEKIPFVEAFTALQVCLQGPLESLLLLDRLLYLKTTPLMTAQLVPLFSDLISPRNMALVGVRRDQ